MSPAAPRLVVVDALDAGALAAVHADAFAHPWSERELAALLDGPGVTAVGAEDHGTLTGFVLLRCVAGEAEVLTLAVRQAARRRGIALALVEAAAARAAAGGAEALWLEVGEDNLAAQGLYRACGFAVAGRRRGYYAREAGGREDALVMQRVLNTTPA